MKLKNLIIYLLLVVFCNCKSIKVESPFLNPKKGEIAFLRENIIIDSAKYEASLKDILDKTMLGLEKQVRKEKKENSEEINEADFSEILEASRSTTKSFFESTFNNSIKGTSHHKFQDSSIISFKMNGERIIGDYTIINRKKSESYKLAKKDSISKFLKDKPIYFKKEDNMSYKLFHDNRKVINGYDCFKIEMIVNENDEFSDEEFLKIFGDKKTIYELYVTDKIKCSYHPVFQYKSILDKYYPLEIIEKNNIIPEVITKISLKKFTLQ